MQLSPLVFFAILIERKGAIPLNISESYENYLEAIYMIQKKRGEVHSVDIAEHLSFSKPSVSIAMKKLRQDGFITMDRHGHIALTASGLTVAKEIYQRHVLISAWLVQLGVDEETASRDACRIEHVISKESFQAVMKYVEQTKDK